MKVLLVTRPWSFHGGVENATAGLVQALVEHGHDVHVLMTAAARTPASRPAVGRAAVHTLGVPPLPPTARVLATAALARVAIARGGFDVVQSHERVVGADVYRAGEGCHAAYLAALGGPRGRRLYHRVILGLERRVLATTPHLVAIAARGKREIEELYGVASDRVSVVYNGVDLDRFHPSTRGRHRDGARAEVGLGDLPRVLLFVGSGFERKGLGTAIRAFAALGEPESRLLVVGKGDATGYRPIAETLGVADRIAWLGTREDVDRWYAAADMLLLPARYEPFGNVHLEALASGLPVVTSTRAGGAELVEEGVNGAVREPDDADGIAAAIRDLWARPADLVRDACRRSAEPYTHARQVTRFEAVWKGLMTRKG